VSLRELTDPDAVRRAVQEFDALGRDAFLQKYGFKSSRQYVLVLGGHEYDSKPIVAAAHGFQHLDLGPLRHTDFNGGAQTTSKLRSLGFSVERRTVERGGVQPLGLLLQRFLDTYSIAKGEAFGGGHDAARLLKSAAERIEALLPEDLDGARVKPSVGQGNWAAIPWIAVLDPRITTTTQEGVYPVVLAQEDLTGLYLTIAQGVTKLKRELRQPAAYDALRQRAQELRPAQSSLGADGFLSGSEVFLGTAPLARDYTASVVMSKYFARDDLSNSSIEDDVVAMSEAYASLIEDGVIGTTLGPGAPADPNVLSIYIGGRALENFESGGRRGWWGWKRAPDDVQSARVDDLIVFASGFNGPNVRVESAGWQRCQVRRLVVGRIDKPVFRTDEPIMPDELVGEVEYPWKLRFTILGDETDVSLKPGDDLNSGVVEALRLSATNQGPGGVAPVAGSPRLERYLGPSGTTSPEDVKDIADQFARLIAASGLRLDRDQVAAFLAGVLAKPFVILTGQSGSGKTQLAKRLGEWCGQDPEGRPRYLVVPVRPDWTGPEFLFGYPDGLADRVEGRVVWAVPPTLEFLLRAHRDPAAPYVLVLDEMNLAHVERYFADFLSGIESREPVVPNLSITAGTWAESESGGNLPLPSNVIVIGTVNVDETTYMFSPKVLDRAFVHEFRVAPDDLDPDLRRPKALAAASVDVQHHIVRVLQSDDWQFEYPHAQQAALVRELKLVHSHLGQVNLDFGHRVLYEALRFASIASCAGLGSADTILDYIVMTKLLPKVHGSRQRLDTPLVVLQDWARGEDATAEDPRLPRTAAKLDRMLKTLKDTQFVTFTE
jgi:MoxR-like ATPase